MEEDDIQRERPPSKSQLKRDAHALQELGVALLGLSDREWRALHLPDNLVAALREAGRITSRGARKRQMQLIGKLMRDIDPQPVREYFEARRLDARRRARQQHELEDWRDRMISEGDNAIEAYLARHPAADRQQLRRLVREARKEQAADKAPRSSRALFRYIREIGADASKPA
jgi:ribosome-associated protein